MCGGQRANRFGSSRSAAGAGIGGSESGDEVLPIAITAAATQMEVLFLNGVRASVPCHDREVIRVVLWSLLMLLLPAEIPAAGDDAKSRRIHEVFAAARAENKSHASARMWAYRSLGPTGANVFDFTVSRHRDGPQES